MKAEGGCAGEDVAGTIGAGKVCFDEPPPTSFAHVLGVLSTGAGAGTVARTGADVVSALCSSFSFLRGVSSFLAGGAFGDRSSKNHLDDTLIYWGWNLK